MALPADPSGGGGSRGYPAGASGLLAPAGSPYNSAGGLNQGPSSQISFAPSSNPFPFYNTDTTSGAPSPLTALGQQNFLTQGNGLTNALSGGGAGTSTGDDLYNQLIAQLGQVGTTDPSTLQAQAEMEAGLKYDPLISQLQGNLSTAQTNTANAQNKIGGLYTSLGQGLAAQIPGITQQFAAQQDQAKNNYATLQSQIQNNYQGAQQAQQAELEKLGIQAALPQSTQKLNEDQQYLQNQAGTNGQALQDAMAQMGQGQQDWFQRASAIAPMQGANLQANLAQQLLQLQNQTNSQIAGYRGQEGADAQSLLMQLEAQAGKDASSQQSQMITQAKDLAELQNLVHPGIFGSAKPTSYKGLTGISQYFADNASTADPNSLMTDFMNFENSKTMQQLTGPGGAGSPTFETTIPALQQFIQQNDPGISPAGMSELVNALAIKYGKY